MPSPEPGPSGKPVRGSWKLTGSNSGHILVQEGNLQVGDNTASINWGSAGSSVTLHDGTMLNISGRSNSHHVIGSDLVLGTSASDSVSLRWNDASQANATNYQYNFTGNVTVNGNVTVTGIASWAKEMGFTGTLTGAGSSLTAAERATTSTIPTASSSSAATPPDLPA